MMKCAVVIIASIASFALGYDYGGYGGVYGGYQGGGAEEYGPSNYKFDYGVHDPYTGDNKQQQEIRHGDVVNGIYTLKEADGTTRVVEYEAGPHSGFNAVVRKIGYARHPAVYGGGGGGYHHQLGGYGGGGYQHQLGGYGGGAGGYSHVGPTNFGYKSYHY